MTASAAASPVAPGTLREHVRKLAGAIGVRNVWRPEALAAARDFIETTWRAHGHAVERQTYTTEGVACSNLVVTLPGRRWPEQVVLAGAHYDTVHGSPGADDNASGVAAVLELGRLLSGARPGRTLRLAAFVNEEEPFFHGDAMGSTVYARAARRRGEDIRAMFSLEMLGCYRDEPGSQRYPPLFRHFHPDRGDFIALVANLRSRRLLKRALAAFRAGSNFPVETTATFGWIPGVSWSDHLSFWREGYRAVMVTDTAFHRYPHYHSAQDTPDRLDYPRMARVVEGLAGMLLRLAEDDGL